MNAKDNNDHKCPQMFQVLVFLVMGSAHSFYSFVYRKCLFTPGTFFGRRVVVHGVETQGQSVNSNKPILLPFYNLLHFLLSGQEMQSTQFNHDKPGSSLSSMLEPYAGTDIQVDNDSGVSYDTIDFYEYAGLPVEIN